MTKARNMKTNQLRREAVTLLDILKNYKIECLLIAAGTVFAFVLFRYGDGMSLMAWSVQMWDALFDGRLREFRAVSMESTWGVPHGAANGMLLRIPWAIWNFPIWVALQLFDKCEIYSLLCIWWAKFFLIVCSVLMGLVCCRIVMLFQTDKKYGCLAALFVWGSGTLMFSVGYSMQDEVFYMLAILYALYYTLLDRRILSLMWMTISVTLSPFMVLPALLLLIYQSKKLLFLASRAVVLLLPLLFEKWFFIGNVAVKEDRLSHFFGAAFLSDSNGSVSSFALVVAVVLLWQFFRKRESDDEAKRFLLYALAVLMLAMVTFSYILYYRFFVCVPFLAICSLIISDFNKVKVSLFVFCIFEYCKTFIGCTDTACFNIIDINPIFDVWKPIRFSFYEMLQIYLPILSRKGIFNGAVWGCAIVLLYLLYPRNTKNVDTRFSAKAITKIYVACPLIFVAVFFALACRFDLVNVNIEGSYPLAPAITGDCVLEEHFYAEKDASKMFVSIRPVTWRKDYPDELKLRVSLINQDTNEIIAVSEINADKLPDNQVYQIKFENIAMEKDTWYTICLDSNEIIDNSEHYLYVLRSQGGSANSDRHYAVVRDQAGETVTSYDIFTKILTF